MSAHKFNVFFQREKKLKSNAEVFDTLRIDDDGTGTRILQLVTAAGDQL